MVMLGALTASKALPFGEDKIIAAMKKSIPPRFLELNTRAFDLGVQAYLKSGLIS